MKKLFALLTLLWGGGAAAYWYWADSHDRHAGFRTVAVRRGAVRATIDATGTIEPEEVVDVGAQVAGEIRSFGVDTRDNSKHISYGSPVERGTILAKLDDALLKARLAQTRASVDRALADVEQARAKLRQNERELDRVKRLQAKSPGMATVQEYDTALAGAEAARAALLVSEAAVEVARANLEEATVNLGYATIRSPVKGVILDRRVNIGQTVVASLNAPSLFLIAKDLSRLEIWASVNETDVGAIRVGQDVRFTVGAFPGRSFSGKVAQVRLNASMTQNVVTYTVVVGVDNKEGKLLPYLTARLQFQVESHEGVLLVPNAALRWRPPAQDVATGGQAASRAGAARSDSALPGGIVWVPEGELVRPVSVRVGLTDGVVTEVRGELREGTEVVVGRAQRHDADDSASPFLPKLKNDKKR
jgi:HlyD family secretion protein